MTVAAENLRLEGRAARTRTGNVVPLARLQRATGLARVAFKRRNARTVLAEADQSGCCKLRFPRPLPGQAPEAILINTAGGLTDGDRLQTCAEWRAGTRGVVTTQAAERIYRSRGGSARVLNRLMVANGAAALWLPQETILFDGGRLMRRLEADIAEGGSLLACESAVFGRTAMGETVRSGALADLWRLRYGGRLVYADALRLEGDMQAALARPALGGGAGAIASLVYAGADAEALRDPLRAALADCEGQGGCSVNGPLLLARLLAPDGAALRRGLVMLLRAMLARLAARRGEDTDMATAVLPRVWSC